MKNLLLSIVSKIIGLVILFFVASIWLIYAMGQLLKTFSFNPITTMARLKKKQRLDIKLKQPKILLGHKNVILEKDNS